MIGFTRPNCLALCGIFAAGTLMGTLYAQTTLPATAPTTTTPSQLPSANPAVPRGEASVQWDGRLLRVTASGESLSQVFSQIAAQTGLRISGSAPSDPLYGSYGPAPLQDILSDLVSGLSVNMLFVDRMGTQPAHLSFTTRLGGATPPDTTQSDGQQSQTYARPPIQPAAQPFRPAQQPSTGIPANPGFGGSVAGGGTGQSASASSQSNDSAETPASPNGVKTPQEIFEQLQRMRANAGAQR